MASTPGSPRYTGSYEPGVSSSHYINIEVLLYTRVICTQRTSRSYTRSRPIRVDRVHGINGIDITHRELQDLLTGPDPYGSTERWYEYTRVTRPTRTTPGPTVLPVPPGFSSVTTTVTATTTASSRTLIVFTYFDLSIMDIQANSPSSEVSSCSSCVSTTKEPEGNHYTCRRHRICCMTSTYDPHACDICINNRDLWRSTNFSQ